MNILPKIKTMMDMNTDEFENLLETGAKLTSHQLIQSLNFKSSASTVSASERLENLKFEVSLLSVFIVLLQNQFVENQNLDFKIIYFCVSFYILKIWTKIAKKTYV